jgi:tetratricopeptide (TPR) repeat protein
MIRQARAVATILALIVFCARDAHGQIGRVAGTVTDDDGRPLKGATITAENREQSPSTFTSTSDGKGRFSMLGLRRGSWVFTVQAPGFEKASARFDVQTTRPNPPFNVQLVKGIPPAAAGPLAGINAKEIQRRIDNAAALATSGNLSGAIAAYRELLTFVPVLTSAYLEIGALHERMNDKAGAVEAYKRLAELEPDNAAAKAALARIGAQ